MSILLDDDEEVVPIPADARLRAWLAELSRATGVPAARIAARMLNDIRIDDEAAHRRH